MKTIPDDTQLAAEFDHCETTGDVAAVYRRHGYTFADAARVLDDEKFAAKYGPEIPFLRRIAEHMRKAES